MDVINVEAKLFEAMMARFEAFVERVEGLCRVGGEKSLQKWLDNQDVCQILNVSKRTLQTYRDTGTLPHTRIENKMYYKPEDVEKLIIKLNSKQLCQK